MSLFTQRRRGVTRPLLLRAAMVLAVWPTGAAAVAQQPAVGSLQGDVYVMIPRGELRRIVASYVRLVPAGTMRATAPLCAAFDTARDRYLHLRRDIRVAADSAARGARGREAYWRGVADALAPGLPDALTRAGNAEAAVVEMLDAQRGSPTGTAAHYTIGGIEPGLYLLYVRTDFGYFWLVPVYVRPTDRTMDLGTHNVTAGPSSSIAGAACGYREVPGGSLRVTERPPALLNVGELQDQIGRRYPAELHHRKISGEVLVRFMVGVDGRVDPYTIEVVSSSHEGFDDPAALAVETVRFRPGEIDGRPARVWVRMPIQFRP